jgi:hypothetical protein
MTEDMKRSLICALALLCILRPRSRNSARSSLKILRPSAPAGADRRRIRLRRRCSVFRVGPGRRLLRLPLIGVSVGVSSIAEIQIDGGLWNHLTITKRDPSAPLAGMVTATGDGTSSVEDIVIGTKIRLVPEGVYAPSWASGLRRVCQMPRTKAESVWIRRTSMRRCSARRRFSASGSSGISGSPCWGIPRAGSAERRHHLRSILCPALTAKAEAVGEVNGHVDVRNGQPPPGTESRSMVRLGARYTFGEWRADGALLFGLTDSDPGFAWPPAFTYVFNAFKVP